MTWKNIAIILMATFIISYFYGCGRLTKNIVSFINKNSSTIENVAKETDSASKKVAKKLQEK